MFETPKNFCSSLKTKTIPLIISEINRRFSDSNIKILAALDSLDASKDNYLDYITSLPLIEHYQQKIEFNHHLMKSEFERAKIIISEGKQIKLDFYPNLTRLINLSKTIPVGTATVERSFSGMNRILSYARNSLSPSRASDFMLLSLNRDLTKNVNLDQVLDSWSNSKKRRLPLR